MAYTSNWLRSQQTADPRATKLPLPSERHGTEVGDQYPNDAQSPPGADYGDVQLIDPVVQTPGIVLDAVELSHDSRRAHGVYGTQQERQSAQAVGHEGQDLGWVRQTYVAPPFQDDTTRYAEDCWTGNPAYAPPPEAIQRGINGLPQNNPEVEGYDPGGFRRGFRYFRFVDRKHNINPRVYQAQQLLAREIRVPHDQPAQDSSFPKGSPFRAFSRVQDTIAQAPELWRSPPRLTDTILADQPPVTDDGGWSATDQWGV